VSSRPEIPLRDFSEVERDLQQVLMRLKNTHNPNSKRTLLRSLRELLEEADLVTTMWD
jgi:hypothetical protein